VARADTKRLDKMFRSHDLCVEAILPDLALSR
jgi:hypothetical protein